MGVFFVERILYTDRIIHIYESDLAIEGFACEGVSVDLVIVLSSEMLEREITKGDLMVFLRDAKIRKKWRERSPIVSVDTSDFFGDILFYINIFTCSP